MTRIDGAASFTDLVDLFRKLPNVRQIGGREHSGLCLRWIGRRMIGSRRPPHYP